MGTKDSLKEINKSCNRLREFYDNAPAGITVVDSHTLKFVDYNTNALTLLELSSDEIIEQGPMTVSPKFQPDGSRSKKKVKELIERTLNGEKPVFEWLVKTGKGNLKIVEVRLVLLSPHEETQRIYASFIDIMDRKLAEAKIILQNKKLAEIAFLLSHQVRQPIATILGLVNLFNFKDLNDPFNSELILKLDITTKKFDAIIKNIVNQTSHIEALVFSCKNDRNQRIDCPSVNMCFIEHKHLSGKHKQ